MPRVFHLRQGDSQCGGPPAALSQGYRCPWHCTPGVSEFCCSTRPGRAIKSPIAGTAPGENLRGEIPASPSTCNVPPRPLRSHPSPSPERSPRPPRCGGHFGLFLQSLGVLLCPGCSQWLRSAGGGCRSPNFGAVQPCLSHPCARAAPDDQVTALCHPCARFKTHSNMEGSLGDTYPWQWILPFLQVQKPPSPRTDTELQHSLGVPVSPRQGCHRTRTCGPEVGERGRWHSKAITCPQCPPLTWTPLWLQEQNNPRAAFRVAVGSFQGNLYLLGFLCTDIKQTRRQTPSGEISPHAGVCAGVAAPPPSVVAPAPGEGAASALGTPSVIGGLTQAWGGTQEAPGEGKAPTDAGGSGGDGGNPTLTGATGELGGLPCPVLPAPDDGRAARGEAGAALVPRDGADLVALLWFAEGAGVADSGGGPALHCGWGDSKGPLHPSVDGRPQNTANTPNIPRTNRGSQARDPFPTAGTVRRVLEGCSPCPVRGVWGGSPYPAPFCRCRIGGSCRARRSTGPRRATQ